MKKAIEIPALKGWGEIRFTVLSNQEKDKFETSQDPFHRYFLDLESGYLRWFQDSFSVEALGCGYLISKSSLNEIFVEAIQSKAKVLSFQITTKFNTVQVDLITKSYKLWQAIIDMQNIHYTPLILANPSPTSLEYENSFVKNYKIMTQITYSIEGKEYLIPISLFEDAEEVADTFLLQTKLSSLYKTKLLIQLLNEQKVLSLQLFQYYSKVDIDNLRLQKVISELEEERDLADEQTTKLSDTIEQMKLIITDLVSRQEEERKKQNKIIVPVTEDNPFYDSDEEPPKIPPSDNVNPTNIAVQTSFIEDSPLLNSVSHPNTPGSKLYQPPINWKTKYDEVNWELQQALHELENLKQENQRLKSQSNVKNMNTILTENQSLRKLSAQMRSEVVQLQSQIEEIKQSALVTIQNLNNTNNGMNSPPPAPPSYDNASPNYNKQQGNEEEYDQLEHLVPNDQLHSEDNDNLEIPAYRDDSSEDNFIHETRDHPGDDELPVDYLPEEYWAVKYQGVANFDADNTLMTTVLNCMHLKAIEDRLIDSIYTYYSTITLTSFFRFAKDFGISNPSPSANATTSSNVKSTLIYGEISTIFANSSRIETPDMVKRPEIFKVRAGSASLKTSKGEQIPASSNPASAVLSKQQFLIALQTIAIKLYSSSILKSLTGMTIDQMRASDKQQAERILLEIFLIQNIIPKAISLDLIPWSMVYLQQYLSVITHGEIHEHDRMFAEHHTFYNVFKYSIPILIELFYLYSNQNIALITSEDKVNEISPKGHLFELYSYLMQAGEGKNLMFYMNKLLHEITIPLALLNKCGREIGLIPYLIGEHQLQSIYQELLVASTTNNSINNNNKKKKTLGNNSIKGFDDNNNNVFPLQELPPELTQEIHEQLSEFCSQLINQPDSDVLFQHHMLRGSRHNTQGPIASIISQDGIDLNSFLILIGTLSMQAFPNLSYSHRIEQLFQLIKKNVLNSDN